MIKTFAKAVTDDIEKLLAEPNTVGVGISEEAKDKIQEIVERHNERRNRRFNQMAAYIKKYGIIGSALRLATRDDDEGRGSGRWNWSDWLLEAADKCEVEDNKRKPRFMEVPFDSVSESVEDGKQASADVSGDIVEQDAWVTTMLKKRREEAEKHNE